MHCDISRSFDNKKPFQFIYPKLIKSVILSFNYIDIIFFNSHIDIIISIKFINVSAIMEYIWYMTFKWILISARFQHWDRFAKKTAL